MPAAARTILRVAFSVSLSILFLWYAFRSADLAGLLRAAAGVDLLPLAAGSFILLLTTLPRALRWRILIAPLDPGVPLRTLCQAVLVAYAGNNIFPRAGEVARVLVVRRRTDTGTGALLATVLVERVIDLLTFLFLAGVVSLLMREAFAAAFPGAAGAATGAFYTCLAVLAAFVALAAWGHRGIAPLQRVLSAVSPALADRASGLARSFIEGVAAVRSPSGYAGIAVWTVLINVGYALALYAPIVAFHFDSRYGMGPADALTVMVMATVGIILPAPGGAGTYHYFCSQTLIGLYGVPQEEALAFATVAHAIGYLLFLFAGGPGLLRLLWRDGREQTRS
jgi:uncharacterized protein (TIRG00374 family)